MLCCSCHPPYCWHCTSIHRCVELLLDRLLRHLRVWSTYLLLCRDNYHELVRRSKPTRYQLESRLWRRCKSRLLRPPSWLVHRPSRKALSAEQLKKKWKTRLWSSLCKVLYKSRLLSSRSRLHSFMDVKRKFCKALKLLSLCLLFCSFLISNVPFTASVADRLVPPAKFDAEQVYSPAWPADTESMLRMLFFRVVATIVMSSRSRRIGSPLRAQVMSIGRSPLRTEHGTLIDSPQLTGPSAMVKGAIWGATEKYLTS